MAAAEQRCVVAGSLYSVGCELPCDLPDVVVSFVRVFEDMLCRDTDREFSQKHPDPKRTCRLLNAYLNETFPITDYALLRSFIVAGGVIDVVLLQIRSEGSDILATSDDVYRAMLRVFDAGINIQHFVAGLSPLLTNAFTVSRGMQQILHLASRIACDSTVRDMLRDIDFFRNLGRYVSMFADDTQSVIHVVAPYADDARLVDDVMRNVLVFMGRAWANYETQPIVTSVEFVSTCLRVNPALREYHTSLVVELWRTGWNPRLATILSYQLDTTSVEFVVLLQKKNKLDDLVKSAFSRTDSSWCAVRRLLYHHWPEQISIIMGFSDETQIATRNCCPITQTPMARPVVASDGHTYERDAIVQHITTLGLWSPVTRVSITYNLYDNRILLN